MTTDKQETEAQRRARERREQKQREKLIREAADRANERDPYKGGSQPWWSR